MKTKLSFEVFPPKIEDGIEKIYDCLEMLSSLKPDFISVTYSAGKAKRGLTAEACSKIKNGYGIKAVSHLTCAGATKEKINSELELLKSVNVDAILALRGDVTADKQLGEYCFATDLIKEINRRESFNVYGACYPDGHVESGSYYDDYYVLKLKYELGVKKYLSQLFFDNATFLRMRDAGKKTCKDAEFCAGIMPVLSAKSIKRMLSLSNAKLTEEMKNLIDKYGDNPYSMRSAGIEYAVKQIQELKKEGADGIHLYTMCRADVTKLIVEGTGGW